mgnify:CR=1 FL=1
MSDAARLDRAAQLATDAASLAAKARELAAQAAIQLGRADSASWESTRSPLSVD